MKCEPFGDPNYSRVPYHLLQSSENTIRFTQALQIELLAWQKINPATDKSAQLTGLYINTHNMRIDRSKERFDHAQGHAEERKMDSVL